ncbi:MAG: Lrp/AsnC family transcriptional regulator [Euryarchaeota archaeon]|nr:Lrp/AsnC family transcriptional regulator [Euryarchaeota archaeon]
MTLDDKDRIIITMYADDPDISQERIAQTIGLSQPSVAARVSKLRKDGALEKLVGINPLKMGLYLAKVDLVSNDPSAILRMFRKCPYFANGLSISGHHNLCLFFYSESVATLESIVNGHIRSNPSVREVDFNIVITSERDFVVPARIRGEMVREPPCGMKGECHECSSFIEKNCMGCPATGQYQGSFY